MHVQLKHNTNQNGAEWVKKKIDDCKKKFTLLARSFECGTFFKNLPIFGAFLKIFSFRVKIQVALFKSHSKWNFFEIFPHPYQACDKMEKGLTLIYHSF